METIQIPYSSINNSVSPLVQVTIDNCPGMKSLVSLVRIIPAFKLELTGAWNLEVLDLSYTKTEDIVLASLYVNGQPNF